MKDWPASIFDTPHTAGPWRKRSDGSIEGPHKEIVAQLWTRPSPADMQLMVSAPETLAALQQLMNYVGGWDSANDHPCGIARDAIKQAIGET